MLPGKIQLTGTSAQVFALLVCLLSGSNSPADNDEGSFGLNNFAFATYLGNGFYTTSGQNVFVLHLPFEHTIIEKTDTDAGWVLTLPMTVGFINFDGSLKDDIPGLNDVGTLTFLPGLQYQYPVTPDWTLIPFADYGIARELDSTSNVFISGAGIKSYFNVHGENTMFTLGNRFMYAREHTQGSGNATDYSLIETGLNFRVTSRYKLADEQLYTNFYYINFYYPDDLIFLERTENPIRVGVENEVGITFSNLPDFLFFEKPQVGFGIRMGNGVNVYRLVFGAPF